MAKRKWNRRNIFSRFFNALFKFIFRKVLKYKHRRYSWRTKKIRTDWKSVSKLILGDFVATLTGEIRGFGEWRKWLHIRRHGTRCSECGKEWTSKSRHEFHHKKPLAAVLKVFFQSPISSIFPGLLRVIGNIVANRPGNIQLLCLKCHYKAHVALSANGYTKGAENLIKSKFKDEYHYVHPKMRRFRTYDL